MATKSYTNLDKPVQLMELVTDNGDGTGSGPAGISAVQIQGNVASGVMDTGNGVKVANVYKATPSAVTDGQRVDGIATAYGASQSVLSGPISSTFRGANASFIQGLANGVSSSQRNQGVVPFLYNGASLDAVTKPNQTARIVSAAASTNATLIKSGAGDLFRVSGFNASAAVKHLKLYNKATSPTVGTDTPVATIACPVGKFDESWAAGQYFSTGIGAALTGAVADADTTALAAADITDLTFYFA